MSRRTKRPDRDQRRAGSLALSDTMATWLIVALIVLTALAVTPGTKESFRLVKTLVGGWLGLASLIAASWTLRDAGVIRWRAVASRPIVLALVPLTLVVLAGRLTTTHPDHYRQAAADYLIGVACLAGWSLSLPSVLLWRALRWTLVSGAIVAGLALDQALGVAGVLDGLGVTAPTERLAITSTLGNPGDVAASLVLPALVGLVTWLQDGEWARRRGLVLATLAVMGAGLVATATLAAMVAAAVGLASIGWVHAARTPAGRRLAAGATVALVVASLAVGAVRSRAGGLAEALRQGDVNAVLTGRLDGWRASVEMMRQHPLTGVGQGGFRAAYADTRLTLMDRGVAFYAEQDRVMFATPHNEALSVAAEQGWPGAIALAWAVGVVVMTARRIRDRAERTMALAGLTALGTLSIAWFPLHVAAVAWPWLVFLAWVDARAAEDAA